MIFIEPQNELRKVITHDARAIEEQYRQSAWGGYYWLQRCYSIKRVAVPWMIRCFKVKGLKLQASLHESYF